MCSDGTAYVWIAMRGANKLSKYSLQSGMDANRDIQLGGSNSPLRLCWDGINMWAATASGTLVRINAASGTVTPYSIAPSGTLLESICFDGAWLWVGDRVNSQVYQVNPATGTVLNTFSVPSPYAICFDGSNVWVATGNQGLLTKI
jgi:hypothetical protein